MILQTLNSINVREVKCFTGECRFELATIVATRYTLHQHIRYVLVNKSVVNCIFKKKTDLTQTLNQTRCMYDVKKDTKRTEAQLQYL
jgi:hypothetical protein